MVKSSSDPTQSHDISLSLSLSLSLGKDFLFKSSKVCTREYCPDLSFAFLGKPTIKQTESSQLLVVGNYSDKVINSLVCDPDIICIQIQLAKCSLGGSHQLFKHSHACLFIPARFVYS